MEPKNEQSEDLSSKREIELTCPHCGKKFILGKNEKETEEKRMQAFGHPTLFPI